MASINSNNIPNTETLAITALQTAQGQIGQSENPKGSNSGPMVNEYLRAVGMTPGYAWCQAFVYWCYEVAAKKLNLVNPLIRTASVHDCWSHSTTNGTLKKVLKADALLQPGLINAGDQFILSFNGNADHTGIVEKVEGHVIYTIEGNSNNNGSREGYEVVRHQRNLNDKSLVGFIKYS